MLKKSMNNFVISILGKKDKFYNKLLGKRISPDNSYVIFLIDSLADTSKNEQIKLFEAVNKLKYLSEKKNGWDNDKWKFAWEIQHSNSRNSNRKKKKPHKKQKRKKTQISFLIITLIIKVFR